MKHLLTFLLLSVFHILCFAQTSNNIGFLLDNKGQRFYDYYDFDYSPEKPIEVKKIVKRDYSPGYYYDINNRRIKGFIKVAGEQYISKISLNRSKEK